MQLPSILQGESLTRLLQGAAAGAVAIMFVGFYWGGWSLGSTADKMAKERSDLAVVSALAPVCADKFRALPDADAKKLALSKVDSWKRRDEFPKGSEKRLARLLLLLANFGKEGRPEPIVGNFSQETLAEMIGTTRSRVSFFMNRFRKLGFIEYNGKLEVHNSLLNVVLHDNPQLRRDAGTST